MPSISARAHRYRLFVVVGILCGAALSPLSAQAPPDPSEDARYRFGPLAFTPALVLSSGRDTNVYRTADAFGDFETFAVPQIEGWWTQPGFRISGHAALERVAFRNNVGATNGQVGARLDRINSLVRPYFSWNRRRTNASPTGFEIGYKSLRLENDWSSGLGVTLTPRTRARGLVRFVTTNWDADARYQTSSLREKLNRDTLSSSVILSYDLTPLTSIGASAETQQDRFKFSPIRDGDTVRIAPVVEFAKPAWLYGNAFVGYERFRSPASGAADFNGLFASINLGYGTSDGTLLKVFVNRDLQYSYDAALAYYVSTGVTGTLSRRIGGRWDAAAFGGRYFLDFRPPVVTAGGRPVESVVEFGSAIAYRTGPRTRIGWTVEHAMKTGSDGYHALRVVGFLTYGSGRFQRLDRPTPFDR
jgi:Putative beta-barrel porin 2